MTLAQPTPVALVQALDRALEQAPAVDRHTQHHRVCGCVWKWRHIADNSTMPWPCSMCSLGQIPQRHAVLSSDCLENVLSRCVNSSFKS